MSQAAVWRWEHHRVAPALFAVRLDGRNYRQQHGFLSICRLLSDRSPAHLPPFSASGRTVGLGGRAVDQMNVSVGLLHQGFKQSPPYSFGRPAVEAIIDGCRGTVTGGAILPTAARSQNMDDPADDPAVIGSMCAGLVRWKQRRSPPTAGHQARTLLPWSKLLFARRVNHGMIVISIV